MDLKEAKSLIAYARKLGITQISLGDLSVTFNDAVILPGKRKPKLVADPPGLTKAPAEPTLEQINEYIYGASGGTG